jgi:TonB family protein
METGLTGEAHIRRFRLGLGGALAVSLGFHLALLAWLHLAAPVELLPFPSPAASLSSGQNRRGEEMPLAFTFVDVPDDTPVADNPRARLLSDKTRAARQPVPTPPDATNLGPDPHAEGNSRLRQLARTTPPVGPATGAQPIPSPSPTRHAAPRERSPGAGKAREGSGEGEEEPTADGELEPPRAAPGAAPGSGERKEAFRKALERLQSGSYDFSGFDNPSYLQGGNYGTLSFDTKGFDWGDYAREIYLIVKKNWYDRIPIAAWYGQKGKVFIRFVIEKDGTITDLALLRSSDISPLDRAAENAIRASSPLPPLPGNFPKDREGVTFGFFYNLPIDEP